MTRQLTTFIAFFLFTTATALNAQETDMSKTGPAAFERLGIYVLSSDLERSEAFYRALFGKGPGVQTEVFMGFDIAGGLFAVVSKETFAPEAKLGGNAIPYLKVPDLAAAHDHVRQVAPDALMAPGVIREGPISLFKFTDPDGNILEYFALSVPVEGL
ncbi:VOC family protein [Roseibium sp. Sym1]|uniref:VOC family protein n=1 Tax=Roseibium sp. Sym1 TaxID=3016006 RepID=UPI0022B5C219|nr:VOC family protein [Roseibium sp. Sym1]